MCVNVNPYLDVVVYGLTCLPTVVIEFHFESSEHVKPN